jgi:hypothetical protein
VLDSRFAWTCLLVATLVMLAGPWLRLRSFRELLARMLAVPLLVVLPFLAWSLSFAMLEPHWPGSARAGWTSCLLTTGYVWLPAVLWASAAMYAAASLGVTSPAWVRTGLLVGCLTSLFSTIAAAWMFRTPQTGEMPEAAALLLWPGLTCVAHATALAIAIRSAPLGLRAALTACATTLALIAANVGAAMARVDRTVYQEPPTGCYVVTAATRGHRRLVRPLREERRGDGFVLVNRQLIVLRELEARWAASWPRSHAVARRAYDTIGPAVARRLRSPWAADAAYLSLKPLEWAAAWWIARRR